MGRSFPTIRPARAEDASFIARNILAAQRGPRPRGWFDITLDLPEPQCLAFVESLTTAPQRSWWHVSHFVIAEVEGQKAAALCALPASGTLVAARAAIAAVAGGRGLGEAELMEIFRRGAYAAKCWVQGGEGDWLIEHVATLAAYRGRGLVQALIERALDQGRAAGFTQASISFLIGNDPAERSYVRAGFTFAEEKRDPDFEALTGAPGFRRFVRALT